MKILWLSHFIPYPPNAGILQRGYHLIRETAKHHEVHLIAFKQMDLINPFFSSPDIGISEAKNRLRCFCKSVDFVPLPYTESQFSKSMLAIKSLFTSSPYTMNWLISKEYAARIMQLTREVDFDLVHFDTISLAPYQEYCGNRPCSLDHHNIESHMLLRRAKNEKNPIKSLYFYIEGHRLEKCEELICQKFSFNFTCSEVDSQRLRNISPKSKVYTVANGVDTNYFKPGSGINKQNRLVFVGTLSWYPNIAAVNFIAEKIWPLAKKKYPDIIFDVIGANPPKSLQKLSSADSNFRVHGPVDDIRPYLDAAKCFVCPIKDGGGTKLKIIDALSSGMAIVADEVACEGIEVVNGRHIIFASSAAEYLHAISSIMEEDDLRLMLQSNARIVALEKYSYESIGQILCNLFATHLNSKKGPKFYSA